MYSGAEEQQRLFMEHLKRVEQERGQGGDKGADAGEAESGAALEW